MKILYIHPSIRRYRLGIFTLLQERLSVNFFWSGSPKIGYNSGFHEYHEIKNLQGSVDLNAHQARELHFMPVSNFSLDLFKIPFSGYNVVIFSNVTSTPFLILAPILYFLGAKIILFDELWRYPIEVKKYRVLSKYVKFLVRKCVAHIIVAGSKAKSFFIEYFETDPSRVDIAFNTTLDFSELCVDEKLMSSVEFQMTSFSIRRRLLYLGRLVEYKGFDILLKALVDVSNEFDLFVVGEFKDERYKQRCLGLIEELRLTERVHFLGPCLSDMAPYYYKCSEIFVLPTRFMLSQSVQTESWGFTVNEALSLNCRVVATTAVGSAYDLLLTGVTGSMAVAGDAADLAEKINYECSFAGKDNFNCSDFIRAKCNYEENFDVYRKVIKQVMN